MDRYIHQLVETNQIYPIPTDIPKAWDEIQKIVRQKPNKEKIAATINVVLMLTDIALHKQSHHQQEWFYYQRLLTNVLGKV